MGSFSYMCQRSGKPVNRYDRCYLFLVIGGEIKETMYGNYDGYGRVLSKSRGYKYFNWDKHWDDIVNIHFNDNNNDGIAAILADHYDGIPPTEQSEYDDYQGFGRPTNKLRIKAPYHTNSLKEKLKAFLYETS